MLDEPTNMYRVVAQSLQWIHGITSLQYDILRSCIVRTEHDGEANHSFDVVTNGIRLGGIKHPMGLVIEQIHIALSGDVLETNAVKELVFNNNVADIEIHDMLKILVRADISGMSNISVQTKFKLFDGEENSISRQFLFKNNMIFQIR